VNSRKDLEKTEICGRCEKKFPRKEMRGSNDGSWLCVPDWEDKHGMAAPPPLPNYKAPQGDQ
jgi:hypothetical protein